MTGERHPLMTLNPAIASPPGDAIPLWITSPISVMRHLKRHHRTPKASPPGDTTRKDHP